MINFKMRLISKQIVTVSTPQNVETVQYDPNISETDELNIVKHLVILSIGNLIFNFLISSFIEQNTYKINQVVCHMQ